MAKPFTFNGYTKPQAAAIHQALKPLLLPGSSWPRLLKAIANAMHEAYQEIADPVVYAGEAARRLTTLATALEAAEQAHQQLGEKLQWHLDNQLPNVPLVRDGYSDEWRTTVRCLLSSDQFPGALNAVRQAVDLAAKQQSPFGPTPTTGTPKNYVMRWAVRELLHIFEAATGIPPTVSATSHTNAGYAGKFYPFAVACLAPMRLVPAKTLGSNILTAYREWRRSERAWQDHLIKQK